MIEPLPCPFCGKAPCVFPIDPTVEGNAWGMVQCVNKHCSAQPKVNDGATLADERGSDKYKEAAIRRWNRRRPLEMPA
jgi:hypothetical protein